jgi:hypothetical protein
MEDLSHHPSKPRASAGYRPLVPAEFNKGAGNSATVFVSAAAGLGLVVGASVAISAAYLHSKSQPQISSAFNTNPSGMKVIPATYATPGPSLLSQVDSQSKPPAGPALLKPISQATTGNPAVKPKKHGARKPLLRRKGAGKNGAKRPPYVSPKTLAAEPPTSQQQAAAATANGPFFVGIEGELTVASYDGTDGKIETYEGSNFQLDKSTEEASAIRWEDFPFNVHYRCDESGKCTLQRGGVTVIARMTR